MGRWWRAHRSGLVRGRRLTRSGSRRKSRL